jgi:hypothetical protein
VRSKRMRSATSSGSSPPTCSAPSTSPVRSCP